MFRFEDELGRPGGQYPTLVRQASLSGYAHAASAQEAPVTSADYHGRPHRATGEGLFNGGRAGENHVEEPDAKPSEILPDHLDEKGPSGRDTNHFRPEVSAWQR
jgi:hypothetical protein